jgi:hypothetical protein
LASPSRRVECAGRADVNRFDSIASQDEDGWTCQGGLKSGGMFRSGVPSVGSDLFVERESGEALSHKLGDEALLIPILQLVSLNSPSITVGCFANPVSGPKEKAIRLCLAMRESSVIRTEKSTES